MSADKREAQSRLELGRLFGSVIRAPIDAVLSVFVDDEDGTNPRLWRFWAGVGVAPIEQRARLLLEKSAGFDVVEQVAYPLGEAHPALAAPGPSMLDAYASFRAMIRSQYPFATEVEQPPQASPERNMVTFGSPNSNEWARLALGYNPLGADGYQLGVADGFGIESPIRYGTAGEGKPVNRLRYHEPHWNLVTPDGALTPRLLDNGVLEEDYLVLSSTPNLGSPRTARALAARLELQQNPALALRDHDALTRLAQGPIDRLLIVGGLHGPGTAAAKLLLNDLKAMERLASEVRNAGAEGGFWQAVVRTSVAVDKSTPRDSPSMLHEIRAYPIKIPQPR